MLSFIPATLSSTRVCSLDNVVRQLSDDGYELITSDAEPEGKRYLVDTRCNDLLCFAGDQRHFLEEHELLKTGEIVMQVRRGLVRTRFTTPGA